MLCLLARNINDSGDAIFFRINDCHIFSAIRVEKPFPFQVSRHSTTSNIVILTDGEHHLVAE